MSLMIILLEKKKSTAPELAKILEVSTRTIYRDIEILNIAGVPIISEQGISGGISIIENYKINNKLFNKDDIGSLLLALNNLPLSNNNSLNVTMSKLKTLIPSKDLEKVEFKANQIYLDLNSWDGNEISKSELNLIKESLDSSKLISFNYKSFNEVSSERKIEPYRLVLKGSYWYLQGYCLSRNDFRTFKVSRISNLNLLSESFTPREFKYEENKINSWEDSSTIKVKLLVDTDIKNQLEHFYGPSVITNSVEDKYIAFIPFNNTPSEYRYLLGFANKAKILEPSFVKENLLKLINDTFLSYQ